MLQSLISFLPGSGGGARLKRREAPEPDDSAPAVTPKWIWTGAPCPARNCYIQARKEFILETRPVSAVVRASADSKYKLYLNGAYAGRGPVRSGEGYVYVDSYDVTGLLRPGKNAIAFLVHHIGESTYSYIPRAPGLICTLELNFGDSTETIVSDETWMTRRALDWTDEGGRMSRRLGFQEVYDAGHFDPRWNLPDIDLRGWTGAVVVGVPPDPPWGELRPREIPLLREETVLPVRVVGFYNSPEFDRETPVAQLPEIMASAKLTKLRAGRVEHAEALTSTSGATVIRSPRGGTGVVVILDFGREVFGCVELGISDSGGGCIDLGYGELLEEGRVKPNRAGTRCLDRVMLGKGPLEWQGFEPRGFRYLQMEFRGLRRPVVLDYVRVNQITYPVEPAGHFECSDSLLNEIWRVGAYTTRLCMEDAFIDCPWRERAQWWADARIESRAAFYAFGDTALLAQGLRQIAHSQRPDGSLLGMYPAGEERMLPDFSLIWVFSLLDYYAFSDDAGLVRELYPTVRRLMDWFAGFEDEDALLYDVPGWIFIDWAEIQKQGEVTALNCFYYQALRGASFAAGVAGEQEDSAVFLDKADRLRRAINKHLYSPRRGLYADCRVEGRIVEEFSRQTNILAALFDIPDHYQKASIFRQLSADELPEIKTPYFTSYLLEALYSGDRHDEALDIIRRKWGDMIREGAGTFWEMFTQEGSLCHGWSACPTRDLLAEYVGIKPTLGAPRFTVAPHTGGLKWARGSVPTPAGPLSVEWRAVRNSLNIEVSVPEGIRVDLYAPAVAEQVIVTVDRKTWRSRFVTLGPGTHAVRVTAERQTKPSSVDAGPPPAPVPLVEVLDDVPLRVGHILSGKLRRRRGTGVRKPGGRAARSGLKTESAAEQEARISGETAPAAPTEQQEQVAKKPRPRKAGVRKRPKSAGPETQNQEQTHTQPAEAPRTQEESAETSAQESRRRRGRSRSRKTDSRDAQTHEPAAGDAAGEKETQDGHHQTPQTPETTAAAEVPAASAKRRARQRRPRRRGNQDTAETQHDITDNPETTV